MSYKNSIRLLNIPAPRGTIYDRNNKIIADNTLSFNVFIVPQEAEDLDGEIARLSQVLGVSESLLRRNYNRNYQAPFAPCELLSNISKKQAILIEETKLDMPGVLVKEAPRRDYRYKDACGHVTGYISEIGRLELDILSSYGYNMKDLIGKDGVERVFDSYLRGRNGGMQVQVDNRGRQAKVLNLKEPIKGSDVYLTIDGEFQDFVWKMMKNRIGSAIFMDPYSGEILCMISSPSYDPNEPVTKALNEMDSPLLNRSIAGLYPPGSLFKIVTSLGVLECGKIEEDTSFLCKGHLKIGGGIFNCWDRDGHGIVNLDNAIIHSCNVYFYNVGLLLGVDRIYEYARQFGLGRKTGIELFGEQEGFVPSRQWKRTEKKDTWYAGDTANLSIGQGYLLVTPLQIVRLFAIAANGGELVMPHILKSIEGSASMEYKNVKLKLRPDNIDLVRKGLKGVVENVDGTGFRAWSSVVSISGKTGTSQPGSGFRTHAWFSGYAPSKNPKIVFIVFLEHGGSGGDEPAMIAKKAIEYWYRKNR